MQHKETNKADVMTENTFGVLATMKTEDNPIMGVHDEELQV